MVFCLINFLLSKGYSRKKYVGLGLDDTSIIFVWVVAGHNVQI